MSQLEQIIRPWQSPNSSPVPFTQPGAVGSPNVHMIIGSPAGLPKTLGISYDSQTNTYLQANNPESIPYNGWPS